RSRRVNSHHQLVGRTFDVDRADARALQLFLQLLAKFDVFVKEIGVVLVGEPPRLPRFVVAQPESVRVRLLSHDSPYFFGGGKTADYFLPFFEGACFPVKALRTRRAVLRLLPPDQIHHQPRLLRRHSHVPRQRVRFNQCILCLDVSHDLCLRRRGCCCWRCAASCWCRARRLLERRLHAVALERTRRCE